MKKRNFLKLLSCIIIINILPRFNFDNLNIKIKNNWIISSKDI